MTIAKQHTIDDFLSFIRENDGGLFSFGEAGAGPDKATARQFFAGFPLRFPGRGTGRRISGKSPSIYQWIR